MWLDITACTPSTDVQFSIVCQCADIASFAIQQVKNRQSLKFSLEISSSF